MTTSDLVFLPGPADHSADTLGRFLPRLPRGAASAWVKDNLPSASWVIDPFGASPQLALEIAQAGYRVLLVANNPITRFLLEMQATPPTPEEMRAALADLATSRRGDERMEAHIRGLYATTCDNCGQSVEAQAFLWEKDAQAPYARIYACPHCQHHGEFPATPEDIQRATQFSAPALHQARALERVAASDSPNRQHAEEALEAYLPRAVYALITLVNKLDGLNLQPAQSRDLQAMLLTTFDLANNLWHVPAARFRPLVLSVPTRFKENNIWMALESAIDQWAGRDTATALTIWPEPPPESGGICLFEGRMKDLASQVNRIPIGAVVSVIPRPNQAFWTLCALWAGWLWGRKALGPFVSVLKRRRYDWNWHAAALYNSLGRLAPALPPDTPFWGIITENEAGFDAAAMVAADLAGFVLQGVALRLKGGQTQCLWRTSATRPTPARSDPLKTAAAAIRQLILARGEPTPYLYLQASALQTLSGQNSLAAPQPEDPNVASSAYNRARQIVTQVLSTGDALHRYQAGKSSIEIGKWWPHQSADAATPLADRVEMTLVNLLQENPNRTRQEIERHLCQQFPGLQTPDETLIEAVLQSYAEQNAQDAWTLRANDTTEARREDVVEITQVLVEAGERLGFTVAGRQPLAWQAALNSDPLFFYVVASANVGSILFQASHAPEQGVIVLPGGRAKLVLHKLERDPRLAYQVEGGWRFLKFRFVRRLAESGLLTRTDLASYFALDPLTLDDPQMPLL